MGSGRTRPRSLGRYRPAESFLTAAPEKNSNPPRSHQNNIVGTGQSSRRHLTMLCREYGLDVHHHRGSVLFRYRRFIAGSVKEAIAYAEGYGQGYFEGMSDEALTD